MWQDTGLNGDAQRIEQLGWMLFLKIFSDKDKELELLDESYVSPIPDKYHWVKEKGNWAGDDEGNTDNANTVSVFCCQCSPKSLQRKDCIRYCLA